MFFYGKQFCSFTKIIPSYKLKLKSNYSENRQLQKKLLYLCPELLVCTVNTVGTVAASSQVLRDHHVRA